MQTNDFLLKEAQARESQSLDQQVVGLLDHICRDLEITEAMFNTAQERYSSIATYLAEDDSPLAAYQPVIYPQGSFNLGTTVKPIAECEFDVDVICQLAISERAPQQAFLDLVFRRLEQRGIYTLRRMNRCVRVQYANEFHIDITPGIPDLDLGPENIKVTDKDLGQWKESNPKDYGPWFKAAAELQPVIIYESREIMAKLARIEPLPGLKFTKPPLNRITQLMKRHRDIVFQGGKDAPISAVITTLAARSYRYHARNGEFSSMVEFLKTVVADMPSFIVRVGEQELVPNPVNPMENYADKWTTKPQRRATFHRWHGQAVAHLQQILDSIGKGKQALYESLSSTYGEDVVKRAAIQEAELRRTRAEKLQLGITRNTGFTAPLAGAYSRGQSVLPVKKHTYFGE